MYVLILNSLSNLSAHFSLPRGKKRFTYTAEIISLFEEAKVHIKGLYITALLIPSFEKAKVHIRG